MAWARKTNTHAQVVSARLIIVISPLNGLADRLSENRAVCART
jgi:hypothetical protein